MWRDDCVCGGGTAVNQTLLQAIWQLGQLTGGENAHQFEHKQCYHARSG